MNELPVRLLIFTGVLSKGQEYGFYFDHQFIETGKYDAQKFTGYSPRVAVVGDYIVGIENRDNNANVRFCRQYYIRANRCSVFSANMLILRTSVRYKY